MHVLRRRHKKPRGIESVQRHFQCDGTALLMVGDRYLTDVVFGNLHGMLTVHTQQLTTEGDNRVAQAMRRAEDWLVARYVRRGVRVRAGRAAADASWEAEAEPEWTVPKGVVWRAMVQCGLLQEHLRIPWRSPALSGSRANRRTPCTRLC